MKNKAKKIVAVIFVIIMTVCMCSCASWERAKQDLKSDFGGGLYRTIKVYTATGDLLAEYEGKIDIEQSEGGYVKFDFNGKRYIYYNCFVETIANL